MQKIAIVILNWNGSLMLREYLPSVVKHSPEAEIIVADNASTDDSIACLKEHFPKIRIITLEKNWGFADGYNKALAMVQAEYYLLLNNDVKVEEGWLTPLLTFMDKNKDVAACQPKLLSVTHPDRFEYAGASGGFIDKYGYPYCRGRVFNITERDHGQYDTIREVLWATGACLMIRSEDYWQAGGLDGRFFAHNEEIDLCWRLNIMGRKVVCVPQSKAYHLGGGTLNKNNPRKTYLNFRNNLTMLYKNLSDEELTKVLRVRTLLDYMAAFEMLILGRSLSNFKAVMQARRDFKAWRKDFKADRERIQASRKCHYIPGKTSFSLLRYFYLKGVRRFSSLPKM